MPVTSYIQSFPVFFLYQISMTIIEENKNELGILNVIGEKGEVEVLACLTDISLASVNESLNSFVKIISQ